MNNPIPLDLAQRVCDTFYDNDIDAVTDIRAALAAYLPELAACHYREVDVEVIAKAIARRYGAPDGSPWMDEAREIAAALSDATNGGHWEDRTSKQWEAAVGDGERWQIEATAYGAPYRWRQWVPANPDAALLAIVDADTLARLREVAEVTAR